MTENERLGQVVVKPAAAVGSGKKLCERREGWGVWWGVEEGGMLCISVFMSFGLCVFRGTTTMTPVSPWVAFPRISLDIDVAFPTSAVTSTVSTCMHVCVYLNPLLCTYTFVSSVHLLLFPPFKSTLKVDISFNLFPQLTRLKPMLMQRF